MSDYRLTWTVPYEGDSSEDFDTPDDVLAWLDANRSRYEYSLDNVTLHGPVGEVDVYGLYARARPGNPSWTRTTMRRPPTCFPSCMPSRPSPWASETWKAWIGSRRS
jgi:hypothetical protein